MPLPWQGSLAFFTLFSIAPVMIVIVGIIGLFFGEEAAQGQVVLQLQETIGLQAAEAVQSAVARSQMSEGGIFATIAGVLAMIIGANHRICHRCKIHSTLYGMSGHIHHVMVSRHLFNKTPDFANTGDHRWFRDAGISQPECRIAFHAGTCRRLVALVYPGLQWAGICSILVNYISPLCSNLLCTGLI